MYIFKSKDLVKALGIFSFFIGFSSIVEGAQQVVEKKAATQSGGAGSQATRPEAPNKAQPVELERSGVNDLGSPATTTVIAKIKYAVPQ